TKPSLTKRQRVNRCVPSYNTVTRCKPFELRNVRRGPVDDGARRERLRDRVEDHAFAPFYADGRHLHGHDIGEDVDREPGKTVAFGVNEPKRVRFVTGRRARKSEVATVLDGGLDAPTKQCAVDGRIVPRKDSYRDRRAGSIEPASEP